MDPTGVPSYEGTYCPYERDIISQNQKNKKNP
jgi:hypothetical protein